MSKRSPMTGGHAGRRSPRRYGEEPLSLELLLMLAVLRRIGISIAGVTLILVGVVLLVLPGPGLLLIAAGLGLLATEFPVVRRFVDRLLASRAAVATRARWQRVRGAVRR